MRSHKAIAWTLVLAIGMSVLCCGCSGSAKNNKSRRDRGNDGKKDPEVFDEELPENEILAIIGDGNEAWGHQSSKIYVQTDGDVYYSQESFEAFPKYFDAGLTDDEKVALLEKYTRPAMTIDEDDIHEIYHYMLKIDQDAEFKYSDEYCYDAGTSYTNVYVKGKCIRLSEAGDRNGELDDRNAKKVDSLLSKAIGPKNNLSYASVYSAAEVFLDTIECSKTAGGDYRRIITNLNELIMFEKDTGIDLRSLESFEYFGDPDYDSFSYICIAVEIFDYHEKYQPVTADAFIVSNDYTGFASLDDPTINMDTNQAPTKQYCYVVQLPYYSEESLSDYDAFLNGV